MRRQSTSELNLSGVHYISGLKGDKLEFSVQGEEDKINVLKTCDEKGRFKLKYLEGIVTKIFFQSSERIDGKQKQNHGIDFQSEFTTKMVSYNFQDWQKAGKPIKIKLQATEKYSFLECI
jgi:hypothetical protein